MSAISRRFCCPLDKPHECVYYNKKTVPIFYLKMTPAEKFYYMINVNYPQRTVPNGFMLRVFILP